MNTAGEKKKCGENLIYIFIHLSSKLMEKKLYNCINFFLLSQAIVTLRSHWQRAGTAKAETMTLTGSRPIPERSLHQIRGCPQVRRVTLASEEEEWWNHHHTERVHHCNSLHIWPCLFFFFFFFNVRSGAQCWARIIFHTKEYYFLKHIRLNVNQNLLLLLITERRISRRHIRHWWSVSLK